MKYRIGGLGRALACGAFSLGAGCTTGGGGTGGNVNSNSGGDPLNRYQLGRDAEFDALIAAITAADNQILGCLELPNEPEPFTDQGTLDALKGGFSSIEAPTGSFDDFVGTIATNELTKAGEICDIGPGEDAALDAAVARLTVAQNRIAECTDGQTVDDAESLADLQRTYFLTVEAAPPISTFAATLADAAEIEADGACGG